MNSFIQTIRERSLFVPYPVVPHEPSLYVSHGNNLKLLKKYLHRWLELALGGQHKLEREAFTCDGRFLWIYSGKDSLGDSVMELSGRQLIASDTSIDLLIHPKLFESWRQESSFKRVYHRAEEVPAADYSGVILQEFNYSSIRLKRRFFKKLPFVCLFGYFNGPPRNQTLFSYAAVNEKFGLGLTDAEILEQARPWMEFNSPDVQVFSNPPREEPIDVTICVGGVDSRRTYDRWLNVLRILDSLLTTKSRVCLVGSNNGSAQAEEIMAFRQQLGRLEIVNFVGKASLAKSHALIGSSKLFVGADGGLTHVARSTHAKLLVIFGGNGERPEHFFTPSSWPRLLLSHGPVSNVDPKIIASEILALCT